MREKFQSLTGTASHLDRKGKHTKVSPSICFNPSRALQAI